MPWAYSRHWTGSVMHKEWNFRKKAKSFWSFFFHIRILVDFSSLYLPDKHALLILRPGLWSKVNGKLRQRTFRRRVSRIVFYLPWDYNRSLIYFLWHDSIVNIVTFYLIKWKTKLCFRSSWKSLTSDISMSSQNGENRLIQVKIFKKYLELFKLEKLVRLNLW